MPISTLFPFSRFATLAALVISLASPASAQIRQAWFFEEPAATPLTGLVNAVTTPDSGIPGYGAFTADIPGVSTNGAGALFIRYANTATTPTFAPIGTFGTNSGIFTLTVTVAGWHLPAGTTNLQTAYFDLRSAAATASSLIAELTFLASDAGVNVRFRDATSANNNIFLTGLPTTRTTPFVVTLTVNKNTNTYRVSYTDGGVTTEAIADRPFAAASAARILSHFSLRTLGDFTAAGLVVAEGEPTPGFAVESIVIASTLTPLQSWRQTHFSTTEPAGDAADLADPDADGIPNLLEYAGGTLPLVADVPASPLGQNPEGFLTYAFNSVVDFDLLYDVQGSSDLITWTSIAKARGTALVANPPLVVNPQLVADTTPLSAGPRRFLRLSVRR
ncbi:MAG: hypothetical protein H7067_01610 [Burkholderiales bacterium]|nr:hypothetical protein [Opitutaceae bacterium]